MKDLIASLLILIGCLLVLGIIVYYSFLIHPALGISILAIFLILLGASIE